MRTSYPPDEGPVTVGIRFEGIRKVRWILVFHRCGSIRVMRDADS